MITLELIQGSDLWHTHRKTSLNASDAPAMMGCSSYKTRDQLIAEKATGICPEVDAATQRRFDAGHRFEALARTLAEALIGEDLYPCVGMEGDLSASMDGLTMMEDTAFEHKTLNDRLRAAFADIATVAPEYQTQAAGRLLPMEYQIQMEQQCAVSGCESVLFMASNWDADGNLIEERHCWYLPNLELRARILAGWKQFHEDVLAYKPPAPKAVAVVAEEMESLPAVSVRLDGKLAVVSNLPAFADALRSFIAKIPQSPETDQDFANSDSACKALKRAEDALAAGEEAALAEMTDFEAMRRTVRDLKELARSTRLATEKLVAARKEQLRGEIVAGGVAAYAAFIDSLNVTLGKAYMPKLRTDFGGVIKGKRSVDSIRGAVNDELARAKIDASEVAARIQTNLNTLRELGGDHKFLFADVSTIVLKDPEDLTVLVKSRIAEHTAAEQRRLDAERETIRLEEQAKAQREADARLQQERDADAKRAKDEAERVRLEDAERAREAKAAQSAEDACRKAVDEMAASREQPVGTATITNQRGLRGASMRAWNAPVKCDGDHGGPKCADPECWNGGEPADTGERMNLGAINEHLAPIRIDAAGLASLGFEPVEQVKSSRLYRQQDLLAICAALIRHLQGLPMELMPA